jgi:ABC-type sugar transport system permease subunit
MKKTITHILDFIIKLKKSLGLFLKKIFYILTHNFVIHVSHSHIIWFRKLKMNITYRRRESFYGYLFIGIWIIGFLFLQLYPLAQSLIYSFNKVIITGGEGIRFTNVGFANYIEIFTTDLRYIQFLQAFISQIILYVPIILIISMMIAILLNQKIKLRGFFRSIYFLPVIISSGPVINELVKQGAGSIPAVADNSILLMIQETLPAFISEPITLLFNELIVVLWFSGVQIVLFLAGLQKINGEIYEAAAIDGSSAWESFWKITLPSLRNIILVSAIFTIVMFSTFSNNNVIRHISQTMFDTTKGYGYSAALSWIYFLVVSIILSITALLIAYQKEHKEKQIRRFTR